MKSTNVIIFHGLGGSKRSNWIPWLKKELEIEGYKVITPTFPGSKLFYLKATLKDYFPHIKTPNFESWLNSFAYLKEINENSILIGHSLGGVFLLKLLERLDKPVKEAIFIAPSIGVGPHRFYKTVYDFTNGLNFDWKKIKKNAEHFEVFHSENDATIPYKNGVELAERLETDLNTIPKAGHFTFWYGYRKFPLLLNKVNHSIK